MSFDALILVLTSNPFRAGGFMVLNDLICFRENAIVTCEIVSVLCIIDTFL